MDAPSPDPLAIARAELANNVSVGGWREALSEPVLWIRGFFQISIIVLLCCCIYSNYLGIMTFINTNPYADEIRDNFQSEAVPLSNVTICAQLYISHTFVMENVKVPEDLLRKYLQATSDSADEFFRKFALFLSFIGRPRYFTPTELAFFSKLTRISQSLSDLSAFASSAYAQCSQILKRCWLNGREFDCCSKAIQSIDDDGICYMITLNHDSDNAQLSPSTVQQSLPGPEGGLSIEASVYIEDFPWLEADAQNGFRVYVSPVPFTGVQSPVTAPHAAETFVKVTPSRHSLMTGCSAPGHLRSMKHADALFHDPEGFSCSLEFVSEQLYEKAGCHMAAFTFKANTSTACTPEVTYALMNSMSYSYDADTMDSMGKKLGLSSEKTEQVKRYASKMEKLLGSASVYKARCPSHCEYWTYNSVSSFADLTRSNREIRERIYAKIHVYYAELSYREHVQVKQQLVYLAFCRFGSLAALYLGMSVVSFFDVFFHVTRYFCIRKRVGKVSEQRAPEMFKSSFRNPKVSPELIEEDL